MKNVILCYRFAKAINVPFSENVQSLIVIHYIINRDEINICLQINGIICACVCQRTG